MNLGTLTYAPYSRKKRKRVGRGQGSGHGGTSCRGEKGAGSRSGFKHKRGFEGGQTPLQRRLPKRGFHNRSREEYQVVNLSDLDRLDDLTTINPQVLFERGLIRKKHQKVKILGNGDIKRQLEIHAHAFSASARDKIVAAQGRVEIL
ncbi:MAG: 50S ribosomal protein L15 [candidate division KSB1 bacterium]|nr:50S ribosomal protein L15 [candidate division KSB1 bacterium]MDZ7317760.1 50S ribosomal protein L15 [candidate division KSB1 bacterium]MDZ7339970.1 50S ribosomal protein L15 [candidate division KSB1 bacterium]